MPTPPTPVDPAPTLPDRADRATFPVRMYNMFAYLVAAFTTGVTALATNAYNNAVEALASATAAAASETAAAQSEDIALAAANFKGTYATRTGAAAVPYSVSHLGRYWMLLSNLADVTTKVPGTDPEWQEIGATAPTWITKSADFTAVAGESYRVDTSGGAVNMTLPAALLANDAINVMDFKGTFATNNLTILRNGHKVEGTTENWICDMNNEVRIITYHDATRGVTVR